jgi:spore coat polysaccharide biosynthesis protein SpsF
MNPVIVYSRMSSTRLPGKALKCLNSYQLLDLVCKRLSTRFTGRIIIATGFGQENEPICRYAHENDIAIYQGHDDNLVLRTLGVIQKYRCDHFIRVNADTPFVDSDLISNAEKLIANYSLVTNIQRRTFPYGISVEIIDAKKYFELQDSCFKQEEEHVTKHLYRCLKSSDIYNIENLLNPNMEKLPEYTIDTNEDLARICLETKGKDLLKYKPKNYAYEIF